MWILMGTVFVASLLGSLHCVGMCGPFALLASTDPNKRSAILAPSIAYSLGRLTTYSLIGLLFGALGMALNESVSFSGLQQTATYLAGGLMILVGLISFARIAGARIRLPWLLQSLQKAIQLAFRKTTQMRTLPRAFSIGTLTSLMPCGWLYTFAITAAGTGSPAWGLALMAVFWVGTLPIMLALTLGFRQVERRIQKKLPIVMAGLVILLGVFTIVWRAPIVIGDEFEVVSDVNSMTRHVNSIDQSDLPCCSGHQ